MAVLSPERGPPCHADVPVRARRFKRNGLSSMSLENSLVLGRYRVLWTVESKKLIKTYIARDEHRDGLGTPVLVKHYLHDLGDKDSQPATALFAELSRLTHVRHPGVVSLLDYGTVGQCLVTAHSHTPGMPLAQLCDIYSKQSDQFPPHLAVYIARRLLDTLQQCHTRRGGNFVHGRLTLGCIYLPMSGEPAIADFGLAALEDVAAEAEMQLGFFQTRMSYSAPELTRGGGATAQGDTYSVALLLYRLLTGSNPFRGRSIPETLQRVLQLAPAELMVPEWDGCERMNSVFKRALDKDPAVRFQSCRELSEALGAIRVPSDESMREELMALARVHASADWSALSRLTRSATGSSAPSGARDELRLLGLAPIESKAPAFVSGLITEQPISVEEHTQGARREAREKRERRKQMMMVPTVLVPAAAIIFGLFLGRLGGAGAAARATHAQAAAQPQTPPLVNALVEDLRNQLRRCAAGRREAVVAEQVELEFGASGGLAGVRLSPPELAQSRLGACLLETAWDASLRAPGAMSVKIPLALR
jgi:serine/threonine protein kinase